MSVKQVISGSEASMLSQSRTRLALMALVFLLGYLAVSLRLVDLTLMRDKPLERATSSSVSAENIKPLTKPLRGSIFDRNGELMATSLKMASVYADASVIENPKQIASDLVKILSEGSKADLEKKLSSGKKFIWLARNITPRQEYAINALGHPGIGFQEEDRRIYPASNLASHILGYTDVDSSGISGVEKFYNKQLAEGDDPVTLSIDLRIQHVLHKELVAAQEKFSAKAAIGMVMDVNTGEVVAMVSLPDFDPHHPGKASDNSKFNRGTLGVFEMGSTFKLFSTAAALDSGTVNFSSTFDASVPIKYGRFTISDSHGKHRVLTVPEIFIYSSNIGTARMAETMGPDGLKDFYKRMGFFTAVPVNYPEKGLPLYPKPWRDISTLTASFGHGIAVSPLHLMVAASALVNGGIMVKPSFVKSSHNNLSLTPIGDRVIKPQTSDMIRQLLELVVADGTGSKGYVDGYNVGGKTGTAEKTSGKRYDQGALFSSFLGVFPMSHPRYAVLAILDEPKAIKETYGYATGGWVSAPVVAKVISQMGPLYQIPPDFDSSHDIKRDMAMYLKEAKGAPVASTGDH